MSLGIFKKAFNSTQISDLTAYFSTLFPQKNYKEYSVLITQSGTSAPTVNVLVDDFNGSLSIGYVDIGQYRITSPTPIFNANKTFTSITQNGTYNVASPYTKTFFRIYWNSTTIIDLRTILTNSSNPDGTLSNNLFVLTPLTIKVYN